jgi:hypothetical protein
MDDLVVEPQSDADFEAWLIEHPDGHVINAQSPGSVSMYWHRADCGHFLPLGVTHPVEGRSIKAYSLNPGALAAWAVRRGGNLNYCQTCREKWLGEQWGISRTR